MDPLPHIDQLNGRSDEEAIAAIRTLFEVLASNRNCFCSQAQKFIFLGCSCSGEVYSQLETLEILFGRH
jgi:hypothetical protein